MQYHMDLPSEQYSICYFHVNIWTFSCFPSSDDGSRSPVAFKHHQNPAVDAKLEMWLRVFTENLLNHWECCRDVCCGLKLDKLRNIQGKFHPHKIFMTKCLSYQTTKSFNSSEHWMQKEKEKLSSGYLLFLK